MPSRTENGLSLFGCHDKYIVVLFALKTLFYTGNKYADF